MKSCGGWNDGVAKVLRREGIEPGDKMMFGDIEIEWEG